MAVIQATCVFMVLVYEMIEAHIKKDGGMFLVGIQLVAAVVYAVAPRKGTFIFLACSVLVSMLKFFIIDVKSEEN